MRGRTGPGTGTPLPTGLLEETGDYARSKEFDGLIAVGGGSTIDTCKAANLLTCYPAPLLDETDPHVVGGQRQVQARLHVEAVAHRATEVARRVFHGLLAPDVTAGFAPI